jgi:chitodextrinase
MTAATPLDGDITDYEDKANVKRVKTVLTKSEFEDTLFPKRNAIYTYDGFLQAMAKFPKFCGEDNLSDYTADEACKKELATLFAHFAQESGIHDDTLDVEEW